MEKLKGKVVGLDTMVFIYHFEENQAYSPLTFSIFESLEKGNFNGITSVLTLLEILVKPKKEGNLLLTERYKLLFETFPNLQVKEINENIADIASSLRANYNINTPDAIQIATSLEAKADIFITNDATLKKISEIKVLLLSEMLK
ncbi:type II toxin-antitoxin system VapC family toxin [Candidatus Atribacteria bacterium 1244-E10-H5-B2]|jgi:predicted nucleic acid-binding protein|nr:MAG: type II toxin-antitoxin system VapC family toxin [Candidatus Atribacteria bacterium 1244-E10-H5-B2]